MPRRRCGWGTDPVPPTVAPVVGDSSPIAGGVRLHGPIVIYVSATAKIPEVACSPWHIQPADCEAGVRLSAGAPRRPSGPRVREVGTLWPSPTSHSTTKRLRARSDAPHAFSVVSMLRRNRKSPHTITGIVNADGYLGGQARQLGQSELDSSLRMALLTGDMLRAGGKRVSGGECRPLRNGDVGAQGANRSRCPRARAPAGAWVARVYAARSRSLR